MRQKQFLLNKTTKKKHKVVAKSSFLKTPSSLQYIYLSSVEKKTEKQKLADQLTLMLIKNVYVYLLFISVSNIESQ